MEPNQAVADKKEPNYTEAQVALLIKEYPPNPTNETVDRLAEELGKNRRSVIAKLSNLKIYVPPKRTTKQGTPIVKKETLVEDISKRLEIDIPSFVKANKQDLEKLVQALKDWFGDDEVEA